MSRRKVRATCRLLRRGLDATQLDPRPDHREEHAVAVPPIADQHIINEEVASAEDLPLSLVKKRNARALFFLLLSTLILFASLSRYTLTT